jgi:hypothetical protein
LKSPKKLASSIEGRRPYGSIRKENRHAAALGAVEESKAGCLAGLYARRQRRMANSRNPLM